MRRCGRCARGDDSPASDDARSTAGPPALPPTYPTPPMSWLTQQLAHLAAAPQWTYRGGKISAAEPAAWTALALTAHDRCQAALRPAQWLAGMQQENGAVGVSAEQDEPRWPTSLAILAWTSLDRSCSNDRYAANIERAVLWSLHSRGKTAPREPRIGHDTNLVGWSWAADTHSWLEPTCLFVMALKAAGRGDHPRAREGVRLIVDRLLPGGGANYGNTLVLGQELLPHVQPSGLAMLALAGESLDDSRVEKTLAYLERSIVADTTPASLSYACMGLAAHRRRPTSASERINTALDQHPQGPYEQALLLLAAQPAEAWAPGVSDQPSRELAGAL